MGDDKRKSVEDSDMEMLSGMGMSNDAISQEARKKEAEEKKKRQVENVGFFKRFFGN